MDWVLKLFVFQGKNTFTKELNRLGLIKFAYFNHFWHVYKCCSVLTFLCKWLSDHSSNFFYFFFLKESSIQVQGIIFLFDKITSPILDLGSHFKTLDSQIFKKRRKKSSTSLVPNWTQLYLPIQSPKLICLTYWFFVWRIFTILWKIFAK